MTSSQVPRIAGFAIFLTSAAWCQNLPPNRENVPIYRVTVVERSVKAVDYQYRHGPTRIDFRGTVLLSSAKGDAVVESKAGRAEVDARFERVDAPTRFGAEYLTYVLWAITPEGRCHNLGEVLVDGGGHAKLHATTDLQAFGLIVTAEPYAAVRQPSDVVVIENEIRPDTVGRIEPIAARYDLLPRGTYTYEVPPRGGAEIAEAAAVPMDRYEEILHVYEAQNALQIAKAAEADQYAPETYAKAEQLLHEAQNYEARRMDRTAVVTSARQAAQTAEDARQIAVKRKQDEELAQAREAVAREQELRLKAEANARLAQQQASADRMMVEAERAAQQRTEIATAAPIGAPIGTPAASVRMQTPPPAVAVEAPKSELRVRLLQELGAMLPARDTPRGLVVTIVDHEFRGTMLGSDMHLKLARVASILAANRGLYAIVEGHTDNNGSVARLEQLSYERAIATRDALIAAGASANYVTARGLGGNRPLVSNASLSGREQNRRVEITISGGPIGVLPYWDKTYPLQRR
jgi:outer membrane protein OmpA-like peptidoglycan-associated protein